jgi:hypothetical protein
MTQHLVYKCEGISEEVRQEMQDHFPHITKRDYKMEYDWPDADVGIEQSGASDVGEDLESTTALVSTPKQLLSSSSRGITAKRARRPSSSSSASSTSQSSPAKKRQTPVQVSHAHFIVNSSSGSGLLHFQLQYATTTSYK